MGSIYALFFPFLGVQKFQPFSYYYFLKKVNQIVPVTFVMPLFSML